MSQENVETMRQALDAFHRRDRAAWLALCDPEFETVPSDDWPESDAIRGPEAAWDFYVEADQPWEGSPYEFVEVIDAGNESFVADMRREMRGKTSGAGVEYPYWVVVTFRGAPPVQASSNLTVGTPPTPTARSPTHSGTCS